MRIDMVAPPFRQGADAGAKVPHAQLLDFMRMMEIGGQQVLTGFTSGLKAVELSSEMVLDTFSQDGKTAAVAEGSDLYAAIKTMIGEAAKKGNWKKLLWNTGEDEPPNMAIQFIPFSQWRK